MKFDMNVGHQRSLTSVFEELGEQILLYYQNSRGET